MKIHIMRSGDQYFLAILKRDKSICLEYCQNGAWRGLGSRFKSPRCLFDSDKDARDVAEAIVHVPGDYKSVLDVVGPEP